MIMFASPHLSFCLVTRPFEAYPQPLHLAAASLKEPVPGISLLFDIYTLEFQYRV